MHKHRYYFKYPITHVTGYQLYVVEAVTLAQAWAMARAHKGSFVDEIFDVEDLGEPEEYLFEDTSDNINS